MRFSALSVVAATATLVAAQQPAPISQSTFDNIIQYTRFARASYAVQGCATPPNSSSVFQYIDDATTDGHATVFVWPQTQQIVLAFRGTFTPQNWNSDLDFGAANLAIAGTSCSNCKVHTGFQKVYNGIGSKVLSAVKSAQSQNPGYQVVLVGHSLGGALASLGSAALGANGVKIAATYTYGEPRNGNDKFGAYLFKYVSKNNYYRVTHANDGVPQVPPTIVGLQHHGNEYWQKAVGYNNTQATTVLCAVPLLGGENNNCDLGQKNTIFINHAHVTYSNAVIGNVLNIQDCGAPANS